MKAEEIIAKVTSISEDPYTYMNDLKDRTEKTIIARFSMYAPPELVHAAGAHCIMPWRSNEMIDQAHTRIRPNWCWITRSFYDDLFKEKYPFLDGMIAQEICLLTRVYGWSIARNIQLPFFYFLYLPPEIVTSSQNTKHSPVRWRLMTWSLADLKKKLGEFTKKDITDADLNNSIIIYNKQRALQRQFLELRRQKPTLLRASEVSAVMHCSVLMPPEDYNPLLEELLAELRKKAAPADGRKVRVVIGGHMCAPVRSDYLNLIEDAGGLIVDDDNFVGTRMCVADAKVGDKPIEALAEKVWDTSIPSPVWTYYPWDWPSYEANLVKKNNAKGLISLMHKGCPAHYDWHPFVIDTCRRKGVPELMVQVAHEEFNLAPIKTRVTAFVEMLAAKK